MINIKEQILINDFINNLVTRYLLTYHSSHAGIVFTIENTDSSFFVGLYQSQYCRDKYYYLMRDSIFGINKLKKIPTKK